MISIRNLVYTYPAQNTPILKDVRLEIEKGDLIVLTGPSGCGKTTLCRCLNGLIPNFYGGKITGEIIVADLKVTEEPIHKIAQHVGFVFQNPENQLFALSVEKDVAFGLENLGLPKADIKSRVDWALEKTGVTHLRNRPPHELSGGQQQRVAIASVLAMNPEIIVMDEPTSFLDPLGAQNILEIIYNLKNDLGITVILVEHRLDLVCRFADRIIVMKDGKVSLDGKPREVLNSEEARLIGIGIPKATRLYQLLKSDGVMLKHAPITAKEASQLIRKVLAHD